MKNLKYIIPILALTMTVANINAEEVKGVDRANLDETVSPGQDFYQYACGGWMKSNPLPPQYSRFGTFDQLSENSREQVKSLVQHLSETEQPQGSIGQKVSDLYEMGMDSVRLNNEGAASMQADIAKIENMKRSELVDMLVWLQNGMGSPFFSVGVMADLKNADLNIMYVAQISGGLGDRDYYLEKDEHTVNIRNEYVKYIEKIFTLSGYKKKQAQKAAKNVLKIETALAEAAMTREESRNYAIQYNIRTIEQLKADYPNIDWTAFFAGIGLPQLDQVCLMQPNFLAKVNELVKSLSDREIKDYLLCDYITSASSYLSDDFIQANFDMFSKAMSGKKEMQPRWKRALSVPNGMLGEAVGQLYVEKYFPAESKERMLQLVGNLKKALAEHIASLTWMSDQTKVNALVKLNSFTVKIGYPDKWKDYSAVTIDPEKSYWENVKGVSYFLAQDNFQRWNKPVDRDEWGMTPQTVNAYYNPTTNEICFPAAILQAPYFDMNNDDASNYGAIGVVIGHEMTHGFDDQGRNFDQNGNMTDWWTPEDAEKFKGLADKLAAQFDAIVVADDVHANGQFTLGENIADQGGLRVAYTAFKKTDQGKGNETIDGFTPDQRFYLAYANVWAANITKEEILRRTKIDPHSIGSLRVNATLRNIDTFYNAFGIKAGDNMFLPVEERVVIW